MLHYIGLRLCFRLAFKCSFIHMRWILDLQFGWIWLILHRLLCSHLDVKYVSLVEGDILNRINRNIITVIICACVCLVLGIDVRISISIILVTRCVNLLNNIHLIWCDRAIFLRHCFFVSFQLAHIYVWNFGRAALETDKTVLGLVRLDLHRALGFVSYNFALFVGFILTKLTIRWRLRCVQHIAVLFVILWIVVSLQGSKVCPVHLF